MANLCLPNVKAKLTHPKSTGIGTMEGYYEFF